MKQKLISLLTLLLCVCSGAWAEDVTATWFNGNNSTTATFSPSNDNVAATATAGSGYSIGSTRTDVKLGDGKVTAVNIPIPVNTTVAADAYAELVSFSLSPKTGYDFVPTSINFYAGVQSFGDKNGANNAVIAYEILNGSTTVKAKTNASIGRNDGGTGLTQISVSLSDVTCVSNENLILKIYLRNYSQSSAKNILLYNISFAGSVATSGATFFDMTAAVDDAAHGSATVSPTSVREGSTATFTAESNTGYKFKNWTNTSTSEVVSTANPYIIASVSEAVRLTANFEAAKAVSYSVSSTNNGTRNDNFATEYADENDKFIAPTNLYLSSDNQTLTGWSDGITTYAIGSEIDCSAGDKTLSPVFTANSGASFAATLDARTAGFTTTWNFGSNHAMFIMQNTTGYYVKQATINGASVDIPMFINTNPGKLNTEGDNTERAQINDGTILTIPVVDGSVVTLTGVYAFGTTDRNKKSCTQTTINGGTEYVLSNSDKTATYTYSGATGTIDIVVGGDMAWGTSLSVTYPSPYSVTYDGNGAESGSVTDDSTYDKNASVTTNNNSFVKTGYAFKEWNTEAEGTGVSYFAGDKFTITDNTTLYAQWMEGTEATITYTLNVSDKENKDESTITSENASSSEQLNTLVGITNNTGGSYGTGDKANMTVKIPTDNSYNENHYMSVGFTVANGYLFTPTTISVKAQPVSTNKAVKLVLTDGVNSIDIEEEGVKQGVLSTIILSNASSTTFTGDVTLKIYCYGDDKTYRLGSPITITGAVAPATATVTVGAKGYATYVNSDYTLDFTGKSIKAYVASSNAAAKTVTLTQVNKLGKNTPVLLYSETNNDSQTIPAIADSEAETISENYFRAGDGTTSYTWTDSERIYVLNTAGTPGFYKANSSKVATNKAYLLVPNNYTLARFAGLGFEDDGEATGIKSVETTTDGTIFNLRGQRVAQPQKGLYILNGKKVVLK